MNRFLYQIREVLKLASVVLICFSCGKTQLFEQLSISQSGVKFSNDIVETEDLNIEQNPFMYNGGGVAIGDVNNDGLPDIYFTANRKPDKLYINQGGMKFIDATETSGLGKSSNSWTTGVTMADVNGDGWLDIYLCRLFGLNGFEEGNKLYVNNTDGTFTEKAKEFGLDARTYAQQATFFDYDGDGDLDMFLLNLGASESIIRQEEIQDSLAWDRLFENRNNIFVDASKKAGIIQESTTFGLSVGIGDVNNDYLPDIFITHDFNKPDVLYINSGDGTFEEKGDNAMGHFSFSSHGCDIADINNDGLLDIFTTDRKPIEERLLKTSLSSDNLVNYNMGDYRQFQRNMLHINRGNLFDEQVQFSEVGEMAGISASDWSWAALFADFDLDGKKDLFISNGLPHRPLDLDFLTAKSGKDKDSLALSELASIANMPKGESTNMVFKNFDGKFEDVSTTWGLDLMGCSNGAAYADLDNDGDLDLVLNNLNAVASIYENKAADKSEFNFIKFIFEGRPGNPFGIGARISIYTASTSQTQELYTVKGWLSSMDHSLVFGLGNTQVVDSVEVTWNYGMRQVLKSVKSNQVLTLKYNEAVERSFPKTLDSRIIFERIDELGGIDFQQKENDFIDFNYEKLIPRMLSQEGPKMSVGDVNNDGLDDVYIGGPKDQQGKIYVQTSIGDEVFKEIPNEVFFKDRVYEDAGSVFIDVDQDDDLDLYVVSGGGEPFKDFTQTDRLYLNDGTGHFIKSLKHPQLAFNGSCAVTGDFNQDGVMDIFIGGRSIPGSYGKYPRSRILLGDGEGHLFDATAVAFGDKINLGMVTDAAWLDNSKELVVVGDFMPITILSFRNEKIEENKLPNTAGWWNTIHAVDIDDDGDMDLLIGNNGLNTNLKSSPEYPVNLYVKDFDNNESIDPILAYFRNGTEYPFYGLDKMAEQIPAIKKEYPTYKSYANSTFSDLFPVEELTGAGRWQTMMFASVFIENTANGDFTVTPLPDDIQMAPIFGFASADIDNDGNQDVLAVGNFYGNQPTIGRLDASYGHYLKWEKNGIWATVEPRYSGFAVNGEARDVRVLEGIDGKKIVLVSRKDSGIAVFKVK